MTKRNKCWSYTLSFSTKFPNWHRPQRLCATAMQSHLQRCWDPPNQATGNDISMTRSERLEFNWRLLLLFGLLREVSTDGLVNRDGRWQMLSCTTAETFLLREDRFKAKWAIWIESINESQRAELPLAPCQWSILTHDIWALFWQKYAEAHQKPHLESNCPPLNCRQMDWKVRVSFYLICFLKVHRALGWKG